MLYLACQWANSVGTPTPPPCTLPTAPADLSANASTGNVVLTWPAGVGATGYKIYRSPAPGMGPWTLVGTSVTSPYTDTTGVSGTTYYYTVSSTNACGESVDGIVESHATPS
jgi:cellulose 1,4-beta-cellobiosidase